MKKLAVCLLLLPVLLGSAVATGRPAGAVADSLSPQSSAAQQASVQAPQRYSKEQLEYYFHEALQARDSADRPRLYHMGALFQREDDAWVVRSLLEGYPAIQAGVRRGDRILRADGKAFDPIQSFNPDGVNIAGQAADRKMVELTLLRAGREFTVQIAPVYENLYDAFRNATQSSLSRYPNGNKLVCYVHWWTATRSLSDLIADRQLFSSLRACDGLVLDLRDAFGLFDWQHLDHFFGSRRSFPELAVDRPSGLQEEVELLAPPAAVPERYFGRPMVVLVNEGTRGGMELVGWHLIQSRRAMSAGQPSAGLMPGTFAIRRGENAITLQPVASLLANGQPVKRAEPQIAQPWPLQAPARPDPQFDAALFALMGNI